MRRRPNTFYGLVGLAVIVVLVFFGWTKDNPLSTPFEVRAAFETSNNLRPGSPVYSWGR